MKIILSLILSFFLIGCASTVKDVPPVLPESTVVHIDPRVLQPCDLLPEDIQVASFDDVISVYANISSMYALCALKQADSIKLLKQFGNIK